MGNRDLETAVGRVVSNVNRLLWIIFVAMLIFLLAYASIATLVKAPSAEDGRDGWNRWRMLLGVVSIVAVYTSFRWGPRLAGSERLREKASKIAEAAQSAAGQPGASELESGLQDLVSTAVVGNLTVWLICEIPALAGLIDRVGSGDLRLCLSMVGLSVVAMLLHAPRRTSLEQGFEPLSLLGRGNIGQPGRIPGTSGEEG